MAVTKIKPICGTVNKAIAYIINPEKTDEKLLVSSFGCATETAAQEFEWTRKIVEQQGMSPVKILARHVIQSFDIDEVTPEVAHEIGKQFADEILKGKYEYVLATHIDKGHCHNHIIFNSVDYVDHHAYKSYRKIYYEMREVSDRLCKENGLWLAHWTNSPDTSSRYDYGQTMWQWGVDKIGGVEVDGDICFTEYAQAAPKKKSVAEIAREVIRGKWGNGAERKMRLTNAGYDYAEVQREVNRLLN